MMAPARRLVVLGSTGSIGTQTLDVINRLREQGQVLDIVGLSAGHDSPRFRAQLDRIQPRTIAVATQEDARRLKASYPHIDVVAGTDGLLHLAQLADIDLVVNAVVGSVGLSPTLAALERGRTVALANKESLAIGGELIQDALECGSGELLSIDSEHHALYRCLGDRPVDEISRLLLTASGGPFYHTNADKLPLVTPEQALQHPTWSMGKRITIDCATMVNKAFEVIGAHRLFGVDYDHIDVLIHTDSWVHSLIEFIDGSIMAELGPRDMRIAIQGILCHPQRIRMNLERLPIERGLQLKFEPFRPSKYPAFATMLDAARLGGSALAAMNAADEVLIARFLGAQIRFTEIAVGLQRTLDSWSQQIHPNEGSVTLSVLSDVDAWARTQANQMMF